MANLDSVYQTVGGLNKDTIMKLEQSGIRMTVQRRRIIEILTQSPCSSTKELWYEARQYVPDLGIATVYRLINRLEQIGVLAKARHLGLNNVNPELGSVFDKNGKAIKLPNENINLTNLIRIGLISHGVIDKNTKVELTLVGEHINVILNS